MLVEVLVLIGIGFSSGILASLLGVGGGFVLVPLLVLLGGFQMKEAVALSLTAIIFTSLSSSQIYYSKGKARPKIALLLLSASVPGAIIGSAVAMSIPQLYLKLAFSSLLFFLSYEMVRNKKGPSKLSKSLALPGSFLAGFLSGSLGIGGGILKVPLMTLALGMEIHEAVATSMMMVGVTAFSGAFSYWIHGVISWTSALPLVVGAAIGARIGPKISERVNASSLKFLFSAILASFGLAMLLKALF